MHISYKKLTYLLLSTAILSSDVMATNNIGFQGVPNEVLLNIFVHAVKGGDLKTLGAIAKTNKNFNQIVINSPLQIELIKVLNIKDLNDVPTELKSYAIHTADNLVAKHLHSLDQESLKQLIDFYDRYVKGKFVIPEINEPAFAVYKQLASLGDKTKAYSVAIKYFEAQQYMDGIKYAKLADYRAAPNYKKPLNTSKLFLFVNGFVKGNDIDGALKTLKNYYDKKRLDGPHYTIEEFVAAIPELKQHEATLKQHEAELKNLKK